MKVLSSLKSAKTTAACASANARAAANPMPEAAPVTTATLPVKSSTLLILILLGRPFRTPDNRHPYNQDREKQRG